MWIDHFEQLLDNDQYTLQELFIFIQSCVANRIYYYSTNKASMPMMAIDFKDTQIPHLMGLQHFSNLPVKQTERQMEEILSGRWDFDTLQKADKVSFKKHSGRIHATKYLLSTIRYLKCEIKLVSPSQDSPLNRRRTDMIFKFDKSKTFFVLELRRITDTNFNKVAVPTYTPTSLTEHKPNSSVLKAKSLPLKLNFLVGF